MDYDEYTQARILTNHGHEFGNKNQESYLKIEGTAGAVKITLGLSLDYPKGKPSRMEYFLLEEKEWKEIPLEGDWFPHAFIGAMSELQLHIENPNHPLLHGLTESLQTMRLVETIYNSAASGGIKINTTSS